MTTLYITEFSGIGTGLNGVITSSAVVPPLAEQTVAISGVSAQSAALNSKTLLVRVVSDVVCSVAFGVNPTATTTNMRITADSPEYFMVIPGQKIACISNT